MATQLSTTQMVADPLDPLAAIAQACDVALQALGEDPRREGLQATPQRYARMLHEMTSGYAMDPAQVLGTIFTEPCDEMIVVRSIPFASLCEHHLLPFVGRATVGYVPADNRVVGLSKIPRLVQGFARRLQIQERLTSQIAQTLWTYIAPLGVGVVLQGEHSCMQLRGVRSEGILLTSCLLGVMREAIPRTEFLAFVRDISAA